jgi:uncharacterized protein (TIRG00374 family)
LLRKWSPLIGGAVTVVFLFFVIRNIDLRALSTALRTADYAYVVPALLFTFSGYLVRTRRWQIILEPAKDVRFGGAFSALIIGFAANNLLPGRIGELVRAYALGAQERMSKALVLATIVVERICDGVTILGFLAVLAVVYPLPGWGQALARAGALIFGTALAFIVVVLVQEDLAMRFTAWALRLLPARFGQPILKMARSFMQGLHALRSPRRFMSIAALSIAVWSLEASSYAMLITGFHLPVAGIDRVYAAVFMLTLVNLGNILPASPGYAGSFEFFAVQSLTTFSSGVSTASALAVAAVAHAYQYILITGLGLYFLWRQGMSLGSLRKAAEAENAAPPAAAPDEHALPPGSHLGSESGGTDAVHAA